MDAKRIGLHVKVMARDLEKKREVDRRYHAAHREAVNERSRRYRAEHRVGENERSRRHGKTIK